MSTRKISKEETPTSFGEFAPIGHVVVAFNDDEQARKGRGQLISAGYEPDAVLHYTADEFRSKLEQTQRDAHPLASMGFEVRQAETYCRLTQEAAGWLVVYAPKEHEVYQVMNVLRGLPIGSAQKYGHLTIEDLI